MGSINKVVAAGNVGRTPEARKTTGGADVATVSIACTETYNNKQGQRQEKTEWIPLVLWGQNARFARDYIGTGDTIGIEGKFTTRSWEDKGVKHYKTEVVVDKLTILHSVQKRDQGQSQGGGFQGSDQNQGFNQGDGFDQTPPQQNFDQRPQQQPNIPIPGIPVEDELPF